MQIFTFSATTTRCGFTFETNTSSAKKAAASTNSSLPPLDQKSIWKVTTCTMLGSPSLIWYQWSKVRFSPQISEMLQMLNCRNKIFLLNKLFLFINFSTSLIWEHTVNSKIIFMFVTLLDFYNFLFLFLVLFESRQLSRSRILQATTSSFWSTFEHIWYHYKNKVWDLIVLFLFSIDLPKYKGSLLKIKLLFNFCYV